MTSFRPILPLPPSADNISEGDSRGNRSTSISAASNSTSSDSGTQLTKKRKAVSQACLACRKAKAKCDGARPSCQACLSKERQCVYENKEGHLRVAALRSRIQVLEQQISRSGLVDSEEASEAQSRPQPLSGVSPAASPYESYGSIFGESLPGTEITKQAVDGFFHCCGGLFHTFTRPQISVFMDSVENSAKERGPSRKAELCCLAAVAGTGALYTDIATVAAASDTFYNIAKLNFDAVLELRPLDGIKVCALLCLYNILDKAVASIAYADIGLGLCRRFGLYHQRRQVPSLSDSAWVDYRKTWRTLIFFSTWLSSTLGYGSGNRDLIQCVSPSDLKVEESSEIFEVMQTEMTRIAVLKVKILYMHKVHVDLDHAVDVMSRDLEEWYNGLPTVMHLQEVSAQTLPPDIRRSIYLLHLLYLGANMLLFRRIAFDAIKGSNTHGELPPPWQPSREQYSKQAVSAALAANNSAKIIKFMMDENSVFKRCWIVIFQSYTSCLILLHAVMRKLILHAPPTTYEGDLDDFRCCLNALWFCSSVDPVAARFHRTLLSMYNSLMDNHVNRGIVATSHTSDTESERSFAASGADTTGVATGGLSEGSERPGNAPHEKVSQHINPSLEKLSTDLLPMLCRPFGDPISPESSKGSLDVDGEPASDHEYRSLENMEWGFQGNAPFQWDTGKLRISNDRMSQLNEYPAGDESFGGSSGSPATPTQNRFMDSSHPSDWISSEQLRAPTHNP